MVAATSPLSIIIESKTSSTASWDSGSVHPSPLASHPFRIPTPNFSDLDIPSDLQYSSRPISAANLAGTRTSYLGGDLHETMRYGKQGRRRRSRDDIAALIEFLRTHEPPPDNFMSQPYSADEEERSRWDKVIGRKRSKSMGRAPAPLRLPDSAVAGVTTGGHRHIAISIPLDASHFGDTPKSQYPVFPNDTQPPLPPLPESIRTYKNEKGVVTVLRPLSPDHYYSSTPGNPTSPRRFDRDVPPQPLRNRRLASPSSPPLSPTDSESWPLARSDSDRSSTALQPSTPGESTEKSIPALNGATHSSSEFIRAAYPTRGSSMVPKHHPKHHHATSIDEVIAAENEAVNRNPSPMPREGVSRRQTERRTGRPPVSLATSPVARKSASNLRAEWQADKEQPGRQSRVTQITDSPIIDSREHSPSPPSSIISVKSRREKVRDKKLRDLAAARSSKFSSMASPATANEGDKSVQDNAKTKPASAPDTDSGPTISTIMVVVDVKPEGDDSPEATVVASNDDAGSVIEMLPEPVVKLPETTKGSCNPTPPTSTETSPSQRHGFDTRTSLTRRREWQTNRELERKKREAAAVAKAQLRQLAASEKFSVCTKPIASSACVTWKAEFVALNEMATSGCEP
ncbi:hypothetical protein NQ176_g2345 [Zarea fungicola]|uniref:Uncharacterized protein n=1 Tax=Zarea fungicola TaxID=93591 RepID=A0ACC1NPZ5_9HYPO|nr:hypothetical protein NQ176_g2345 [Lecanicillium fungicola]